MLDGKIVAMVATYAKGLYLTWLVGKVGVLLKVFLWFSRIQEVLQ